MPAGDGGSRRAARLRIPGLSLFVFVALLLIGGIYLVYSTIEAERSQRVQASRTDTALAALNDLSRAVINAETGQRGYLITNDERYLAPYRFGQQRYPQALQKLRAQIEPEATPRQRALLDGVERLGHAKFAEMAESISLVRQGRVIDAQTLTLSDAGQLTMDQMRAKLAELERMERDILNRANAKATRSERRVLPMLAAFAVLMVLALGLGLSQVLRAARAEAAASHAAAVEDARDRADLLARELNHRVKNLFAVILAIIRLTGKDDPAAKPVIDRISQRIQALVTAHEVTQGALERPVVDLRELVETAIAPYRSDSERCTIDGDPVTLSARMAVPMGLVIHELVTNAVKYGAWAQPGGLVTARWRREGDRVVFHWCEEGQPVKPADGKEGFGSMLIRSSAKQLDGTIERKFHATGIDVRIDIPVTG